MRHCYVLGVFTRHGEGGNPLGVVTDVTGLTPPKMQRIAYDLGFSETVFLDWRSGGIPDARIFTPTTELPFAGHPLVGAAWVLSVLGPGVARAVRCQVGEVPFRVQDDQVWVEAPAGQPVSESTARLEGVVSQDVFQVDMPLPYVVAELSDAEAVAAIETPPGPTVYAWAWTEPERAVKARFFTPEHGIVEDPATGSAAVALAAVLRRSGMADGNVEISQGDEIGLPSTIRLRWTEQTVELGGTVRRDEVRVIGT